MAENNGKLQKIDDEAIEGISGGYLHKQPDGLWEIVSDKDGSVLCSDWIYNEYIEDHCKDHGVSSKIISDAELNALRKKKK